MTMMTATAVETPRDSRPWDLFRAVKVRAALRPPERLSPSAWAEKHIVLPRGESARPGRLSHENAPYLASMMDIINMPGVVEATVMKASQIGVSAMCRWLMGYWAATDPDPMGLALPDREKGEKIVENRIVPLFRATPALAMLGTGRAHDLKKQQLKLNNGFILHLMWSGSASALASDPMRRVINDEVDKFQQWAGREAHATDLTRARLTTYEDRRLQLNVSTPTNREGMICVLFEAADHQLYFMMPCPHCGTCQRWVFAQLKWLNRKDLGLEPEADTKTWATAVRHTPASVWYECADCGHHITDAERKRAIQRGRWGEADEHALPRGIEDAKTQTRWPRGTKLGFHVSRFACTWMTLTDITCDGIEASGSLSAMFYYRTNVLGEVFEQLADKTDVSMLRARCAPPEADLPEGQLPPWTHVLIASIDTQKDHFWLVVRAFGPGMLSQRIYHGRIPGGGGNFEELDRWLAHPWPFADASMPPMSVAGGGGIAVIDSGGTRAIALPGEDQEAVDADATRVSRTQEVYAWALQRQAFVRAVKGDAHPRPGIFQRRGDGVFVFMDKTAKVDLWLLDVHHYQTELQDLMQRTSSSGVTDSGSAAVDEKTGELIERPLWRLNFRDDAEYNRHMSNLTKVTLIEAGRRETLWRPIGAGARVDYRACEGYALAAAYMVGVHLLPGLDQYMQQRKAEIARGQYERQHPRKGLMTPDGRPFLATRR